MFAMIRFAIILLLASVVAPVVVTDRASAQIVQPPPPMPPPPAPPPPKIEVPPVPQMDAPPKPPVARKESRRSFNDRVVSCLGDSNAVGLGPNDRAEYSRACANR